MSEPIQPIGAIVFFDKGDRFHGSWLKINHGEVDIPEKAVADFTAAIKAGDMVPELIADRDRLAAELERAKLQAEIDRRKIGEWRLAAELGEELRRSDPGDDGHAMRYDRWREAMAKAGGQ